MELPRMSTEALRARLALEANEAIALVEGPSDKRIVDYLLSKAHIEISIFWIQEIDTPLDEQYAIFGGNKGRILTAVASIDVNNLLGLVDKDFDDLVYRRVGNDRIVYTNYSCLISEVLEESKLAEIFKLMSIKELSSQFIKDAASFSRRMFRLRALLSIINPSITLTSLTSYVEGSTFLWDKYLSTICQKLEGNYTLQDITDLTSPDLSEDLRNEIHIHSFVEYIITALRKTKSLPEGMNESEILRELSMLLMLQGEECETIARLKEVAIKAVI